MRTIEDAPEPYPLTDQKCMGFLEHMRTTKISSHSYLAAMITAFANYCNKNKIADITKTGDFKFYKQGLRRHMKAEFFPNAKLPITSEMMSQIVSIIDDNDIIAVRDMTMYALMFFGFLRFSECVKLTPDDLRIKDEILQITIRDSKTDQEGEGETLHVHQSSKDYCAHRWLTRYQILCNDNAKKFSLSITQPTFKRRLEMNLKKLGVTNYAKFGGHSFRRGGAFTAAVNGVQDCQIKAHGRWKSDVYTRYTAVQMSTAGQQVTMKI